MSWQIKKMAVDIVRGLTGSEDGLLSLTRHSDIALPSLSALLGEKKVVQYSSSSVIIEDTCLAACYNVHGSPCLNFSKEFLL